MNLIPEEWLVCSVTRKPLKREGEFLVAGDFRYPYEKEYGFWDMTPYSLRELSSPIWKTWQHLQENGVVSYKEDPSKNLGVGVRKDHLQFKDFVGFTGRVLDIGVGPQMAPSHVEFSSAKELEGLVGIDPLIGSVPKKFKFIKGLGEYLPFADNFFDKTMFVTSLDHFVSPELALQSAARVTKRDGEICVWIGEKAATAPRPSQSPLWYESLTIPEGAEDRFHLKRFNLQEFMAMVGRVNMKVHDHVEHKVDDWRTNHFLKLKK